ncbi:MAG: carboxymuconolactone decarboxylase family protein [Chloroflexota bacterium]|nr:carboxymuconolactone decarboxylase family protein [Chloroflexota bacterium]
MSVVKHTEYEDADETVKGVYEDIMEVRKSDTVNNFWKVLAVDPELLKTTWQETKTVMASGKIDSLVKEMIYIAVSVTNSCINSHIASARAKGMNDQMLSELMAVTGLANKNNSLANGLQVEVDASLRDGGLST